ncbi:caspase family protein [Xenophilus sp. Marseille-Q4582]|uniref:caspase family protein n=1 Tax=Xenophilus sp. Marseille-Q4582 TaxID=2866600 RepID=UPI001CE446ED|nr:caspase family protein [Xenophilus sp. Marseille-Q4582]
MNPSGRCGFRPGLRGLAALLLLLMMTVGLGAALPAQATPRALLVGVSELVHQPPALWLQAPRNDVRLMREALLGQGFAADDILTLADGVPGAALPEAAQIHAALRRLLEASREGDFVLLYFSGHGTRLRDTRKRYQEPDGLAENFLAREVRGAIGTSPTLEGGLRDVDVDAWVQAFLARNVFVAAVFDTCAAASMTRGRPAAAAPAAAEDDVRWRGVPAAQLRAGPASTPAAAPAEAAPAPAAQVARARYVALFAAESHQVTPELRLPRGRRGAQPHGLLTWAFAESLARKPATWRALFDGMLALYPPVIDELAQRFPERELPSPVAEGSLDAALFANSPAPASARPVWRARRAGPELLVSAGELDGLVPQQAVQVQAVLEDGSQRTTTATVLALERDHARVALPAALAGLPGQPLWSVGPVAPPPALALRVRTDGPLPAGLALDYPAGIVKAGADAEVRLVTGGGATRLEVLDPALGRATLSVPASEPALLRRRLQALARLKWLQHLHALARDGVLEGLEVRLEAWAGERLLRDAEARQAVAAGVLPLRPQERARLHVRNSSGQSLDLVAVGIDAQGELHAVYPADAGESNRFERGTREAVAAKRFDLPWLGAPGSRLLLVATPASTHQGPRLFGAGPAYEAADVRVRGQWRAEPVRAVYAVWVDGAAAPSAAR